MRRTHVVTLSLLTAVGSLAAATADAAGPAKHRGAHSMERVSEAPGGGVANGASIDPSLSNGALEVAFTSRADNLVIGDGNGVADVFRYDHRDGTTIVVSVVEGGSTTADGPSGHAAITPNGRFTVYQSTASNIVSLKETRLTSDIFRYDARAGDNLLVSRPGSRADYPGSFDPAISATGRFVVFTSVSRRFVDGDHNGVADVYLYDALQDTTARVSLTTSGHGRPGRSFDADISANGRVITYSYATDGRPTQIRAHNRVTGVDSLISQTPAGKPGARSSARSAVSETGRYIAFDSAANNLVRGDGNPRRDVFVFDAQTGRTTIESTDTDGGPANGWSRDPDISLDGDHLVFQSYATDVVSPPVRRQPTAFARYLGRGGSTVLGAEPNGARSPNGPSGSPTLCPDGCGWAFDSTATNIIRPDSNTSDIYLWMYN